jgi:hypothetical protein
MWEQGTLPMCFTERGGRHYIPRHDNERAKHAKFRRRQSDNGKLGGRPRNPEEPKPLAEPVRTKATESSPNSVLLTPNSDLRSAHVPASAPLDIWAREFVDLYPKQGRCNALVLERELYTVLTADASVSPQQAWDALKARLASHVRSARWTEQGGRFIPRADKYLREGIHAQEMPAAGAIGNNPKTAGNVAALQSFVSRRTGGAGVIK